MVTKDKYLRNIFEERLKSQSEYIAEYVDDGQKIEAKLGDYRERFFRPKYNTNNKATLHNIIIKYAQTLSDISFEGEVQSAKKERWLRSKGSEPSSLDILGKELFQEIRDSLKDGDDEVYAKLSEVSAQVTGLDYADQYASRLDEHKFVDGHRKDFFISLQNLALAESDTLGLEKLQEALKSYPETGYHELPEEVKCQLNQAVGGILEDMGISADEVTKFAAPDELTPKGFHGTVLRYASRLDEHRFVDGHRKDFFISLQSLALAESDTLGLEKLQEELKPYPETSYYELPEELKCQLNQAVGGILEDMSISADEVTKFAAPDELTPKGFHGTVLRYASRLDEHRFVRDHKLEFYKTLANITTRSIRSSGLHKQITSLREKLLKLGVEKGYNELPPELKKMVDEISREAFNGNAAEGFAARIINCERSPKEFQNTVLYTAYNYDSIRASQKKYENGQVVYIASLLMRMAAYTLSQEARDEEATRYHNYTAGHKKLRHKDRFQMPQHEAINKNSSNINY